MKYTKNVLHEGLKLKGLILFAAIYRIGDATYPLALENIVLVLQMLKYFAKTCFIQSVTQLNISLRD